MSYVLDILRILCILSRSPKFSTQFDLELFLKYVVLNLFPSSSSLEPNLSIAFYSFFLFSFVYLFSCSLQFSLFPLLVSVQNVVYDERTREVDYHDVSITENTRCAYPLEHIPNCKVFNLSPTFAFMHFLVFLVFGWCWWWLNILPCCSFSLLPEYFFSEKTLLWYIFLHTCQKSKFGKIVVIDREIVLFLFFVSCSSLHSISTDSFYWWTS